MAPARKYGYKASPVALNGDTDGQVACRYLLIGVNGGYKVSPVVINGDTAEDATHM